MRAISRLYHRALDLCGLLAGLLLLAIAVGIVADVLYRNLAGRSFSWMLEGTEYALCVAVFLAIPWAMREGAHVRMDALVRMSTKKAGQLIELGADSVGFAIAAIIAVLGAIGAWESFTSGTIVYKSVVFPEWWILSTLPVSMAFLAVEFLRRIIRLAKGEADPVSLTGV